MFTNSPGDMSLGEGKMPYFHLDVCCYFQAEDMQQSIVRETFQLVSKRDDNVCNFLEGGT